MAMVRQALAKATVLSIQEYSYTDLKTLPISIFLLAVNRVD